MINQDLEMYSVKSMIFRMGNKNNVMVTKGENLMINLNFLFNRVVGFYLK